ncbi:T9SS type B sorting domain-containing protein [Flavobacterium eburneipallidum]|uniref:Ig-like domain-containing protein n=1 Tax=Flavobacterium eburneipallidum TaxID=3003263 RepID=UPI0024825ED3|nr:T9SS type B sorting domain-containing protein [Flavobacterium eburneipallidum]
MKKIFILFTILSSLLSQAQYTAIPDVNFEQALIDLGIDSGTIDGKILTASVTNLKSLEVPAKNISSLSGIEAFLSLENLQCASNNLTSLDLSKNTNLTFLMCSGNSFLSTLDLSKNINLTELICNGCNLNSLDITTNTNLKRLRCEVNKIFSLDVSKNTALTEIHCDRNQISVLDVSKNINLDVLNCSENQLTSLDLNTSLYSLNCSENQLTNLDVTKITALTVLSCSKNRISVIDVSKNINLTDLACGANQLTNLDISKNTALTWLFCRENQLTSLDVSKNPNLTGLICSNNQLTNLNLKNGQNTKFIIKLIDFKSNSNLTCIQVDHTGYSNSNWSSYKDATASYSANCSKAAVTATGDQTYCPNTALNIVETFNISFDPLDPYPNTDGIFIQISSGYVLGEDQLILAGSHPTIASNWNSTEGKLVLTSSNGTKIPYTDFESAIRDVQFTNSNTSPSGIRNFSITLGTGQMSYLPSNGHYYEYVADLGINWTKARDLATASNFNGLQGYLATLTAADEAQLAGALYTGATWIGGSDVVTEGTWKWVTGPEGLANGGTGTTFWIGKGNGTTTPPFNYANWDTSKNQPNDSKNSEDYAQITALALGHPGTWNNQPEQGDLFTTSNYYPKGYIVEYGGMPGDPISIQISASTKITIPKIISVTPNSTCGSGSLLLQATATDGDVDWYTTPTGGTSIYTGNSFTTPNLSVTTSYYVDAANGNCSNGPRTEVIATMNTLPIITTTPASRCDTGSVTLEAAASFGTINWYDVATAGTPIGTGTLFTTPNLTTTTTYYVEVTSNGCTNPRIPVVATIYPIATLNEEILLCQSETITLDASISGMEYLWFPGGETSQTIDVSNIGDYSVTISSPLVNCDSKKDFKVIEHPEPILKQIIVKENSITIQLENPQNYYEYSIDGELFTESNQFSRIPSGQYTAFVREKNGCNLTQQDFTIFSIAKYFTPNNDGINDVWEIKEMQHFPNSTASIFDRYGKLLATLNALKPSWNGNYNNNPLSADDYWYVLKLEDSKPEIKGHFSLKR